MNSSQLYTRPIRQSQNSPRTKLSYSKDSPRDEVANDRTVQTNRAYDPSLDEDQSSYEEEIEFHSLINRINQILNQTEFDLNNGEYIYKEHCNELRRQVQLAKETQIQKIEEIADNLMNEIDEFEKESLETVSKVNKDQLVNKLNEMKQENDKLNQRIDEFKVDNQMLNQLRDSLSKIAVERDDFKSLLHNKMMKFKEYKDESLVGELSRVSLDSIDEISFRNYFFEYPNYDPKLFLSFECKQSKILSNGDLFLLGQEPSAIIICDLHKNRIKKIKFLTDYSCEIASKSDQICLNFRVNNKCGTFEAHDEFGRRYENLVEYTVLIMNENLEKLQSKVVTNKKLIGGNDLHLFFAGDIDHKNGEIFVYNWSLEHAKTIGQISDPTLPFYFPFCVYYKFVNLFKKYYFLSGTTFKIVDEKSGLLLQTIYNVNDFCLDYNYNIILLAETNIKFLSLSGQLVKEIHLGEKYRILKFFLNNDKHFCGYAKSGNIYYCWNRYNESTHEVI